MNKLLCICNTKKKKSYLEDVRNLTTHHMDTRTLNCSSIVCLFFLWLLVFIILLQFQVIPKQLLYGNDMQLIEYCIKMYWLQRWLCIKVNISTTLYINHSSISLVSFFNSQVLWWASFHFPQTIHIAKCGGYNWDY